MHIKLERKYLKLKRSMKSSFLYFLKSRKSDSFASLLKFFHLVTVSRSYANGTSANVQYVRRSENTRPLHARPLSRRCNLQSGHFRFAAQRLVSILSESATRETRSSCLERDLTQFPAHRCSLPHRFTQFSRFTSHH